MLFFLGKLRPLGKDKLIPFYTRWDLTSDQYKRYLRGSVRYCGKPRGRT
jgi:hypothetical protein